MTDGVGSGFLSLAATVVRMLFGGPRTGVPKLTAFVVAEPVRGRKLEVRARVTNAGDAGVTIDMVLLMVEGREWRRGDVATLELRSGPKPPFRLDAYDSAAWKSTIRLQDWMTQRGAKCTLSVYGAGASAHTERRIPVRA
ncbi:hypothetical protein GCM10023319_15510 [Nocardia iowensis]